VRSSPVAQAGFLAPAKSELRPTMDVVKGAIFSSLGDFIIGARVLDLFAGSGAQRGRGYDGSTIPLGRDLPARRWLSSSRRR